MPPNFDDLGKIALAIGGILLAIIAGLILWNTFSYDEVRLKSPVQGVEPLRIEIEGGETTETGHRMPIDTIYIYKSTVLE